MLHLQLKEPKEAEVLFQKVLDISPDDEQSEILYNIANSYFFLQMHRETITWCEKIITEYPSEQMEALHLAACSYYSLFDLESCMKCLAKVWKLNGNKFDDEFYHDKRFSPMFASIEKLLNNSQTEN